MEGASKLYIRMAALALAGLLSSGVAAPAHAQGSAGGEVKVSATVRKHASLEVLAQPGAVQVTQADIARGYVDVPAPVQVAVKSNTQEGYLLVFDNHGDFFRQARVRGLPSDVQVGSAGGQVAQRAPGHGMSRVTLALAFRFELSPSTQEGVYAWPMQLSVTPL
jgi:hypothetical protein